MGLSRGCPGPPNPLVHTSLATRYLRVHPKALDMCPFFGGDLLGSTLTAEPGAASQAPSLATCGAQSGEGVGVLCTINLN